MFPSIVIMHIFGVFRKLGESRFRLYGELSLDIIKDWGPAVDEDGKTQKKP